MGISGNVYKNELQKYLLIDLQTNKVIDTFRLLYTALIYQRKLKTQGIRTKIEENKNQKVYK